MRPAQEISAPQPAAHHGTPAGHACARVLTVAAVQAELRFYTREQDFRERMAAYVAEAMAHQPDLVVFPEDLGTGLVALNAPLAARMHSLRGTMVAVALHDPWAVARAAWSRALSLPRALLLAAARRVRATYVSTFSELARAHQVHICAGSVLLPHEGPRQDAVYNTTFLFGPDGAVLGSTDKVNLIPAEGARGLGLVPGRREQVAVWHTAIGSLGVLICLDAWDRGLASALVEGGARLLVVPSANPKPWTPAEEAERREGLYARVRELGVPGVEAFAVGELAGVHFEGRSWVLAPDAGQPDGVRTLARADSATAPRVIAATVELPAR